VPSPVDEGAATVTRLLTQLREGDPAAFNELIPFVYEELRGVAHGHRVHWTGDDTLGTTALVHEAYVKLAARTGAEYVSRSHFLVVAARAIRQILVDHYRSRRREKRGGRAEAVPLESVSEVLAAFPDLSSSQRHRLLALDESLKRLAAESERHARIVECRFFGGMTIAETAEALGVSPATVKRGAAVARAWLRRDLGRDLSQNA
jgi:RNA polymerase sigma factor (TIGR02999 family)